MNRRMTTHAVAVMAIALLVTAVLPRQMALAAGDQYGGSEDDIQLSVDYRWAGGTIGGYYPVRIGLQNRGPSRTLDFTFRPTAGSRLPVSSRRISIDQNASASFTLLIPMAGSGNYGRLIVSHDGRELEKLSERISLPDGEYENARPAILIISPGPQNVKPLEDAISSLIPTGRHGYGYGATTQNNQTIEPFRLPDNWLAYSGLDLVAISLETFEDLPDTQRAAMLDWIRTGGTLLVHSIGEAASSSRTLAELTAAGSQSQAVDWTPADSKLRTGIPEVHLDEHGNVESTTTTGNPVFTWDADKTPFEIRSFGQGQLVGFAENPFSGSLQDWGWLLKSLPVERLRQGKRLGVAGRLDNEEFLEFLIPGIRSVPILAFLIFISLFTFVIGPLNYFVLAKKKRLNFLVVTIPSIAIITSLFLFGYSALSHGFDVKSRVRSLTIIDQGHKKAVSTARLALYAGLAPSDGLSFSQSTEVLPIRASGENFESARTDWTDTQWLRSGWLRSRTRTQFLTRNVRPERGRLTVAPATDNQLPVTNGLEWGIEALVVSDADGKLWFGNDLAAGTGKPLAPIDAANRSTFVELINRSSPANPEDLEYGNEVSSLNMAGSYRYYWRNEKYRLSEGQMERTIAMLRRQIQESHDLPKNTYYAIVKDAPSLEFGTEVDVIDSWHLVIGHY